MTSPSAADARPTNNGWPSAAHPAQSRWSLRDAVSQLSARERRSLAELLDWLQSPEGEGVTSVAMLRLRIQHRVARIDEAIRRQVNTILHHPRFQQLEASWRGLHYLVEQVGDYEKLLVRVLDVSWKTLSKDFERALEFDQSQLFKKVYTEEFGSPGGLPFGLLLGDYEIRPRPGPGHPTDDLSTLRSVMQVAAAAFAPFIASAHASMFGLDEFADLDQVIDLAGAFQQPEFIKWRSLRETEDSRFVGLTMPRVLMRLPYVNDVARSDGFRFTEDVSAPDLSGYLWGSACYAFGAVAGRSFANSGWLADIRGVERGQTHGGLVAELPSAMHLTERNPVWINGSVDARITDAQERELSELGFIPLCQITASPYSAFYNSQSIQKPRVYDEMIATVNARLSAMLHYMLCVGRFSHYIKVMGRDKTGMYTDARSCQKFLNDWLQEYVISDPRASNETKAKYPLREAAVEVRESPQDPNVYQCVVHLRPHYQLDDLAASVKLVTELSPGEGAAMR